MLHLFIYDWLSPVYVCDFIQMYFIRHNEINLFNWSFNLTNLFKTHEEALQTHITLAPNCFLASEPLLQGFLISSGIHALECNSTRIKNPNFMFKI